MTSNMYTVSKHQQVCTIVRPRHRRQLCKQMANVPNLQHQTFTKDKRILQHKLLSRTTKKVFYASRFCCRICPCNTVLHTCPEYFGVLLIFRWLMTQRWFDLGYNFNHFLQLKVILPSLCSIINKGYNNVKTRVLFYLVKAKTLTQFKSNI